MYKMVSNLLLNEADSFIVFLWSTVQLKHNPTASEMVDVVQQGQRQQEEANKDPPIIDQNMSNYGICGGRFGEASHISSNTATTAIN